MLRRTTCTYTGLAANGVIGIRREDKNVWERRVPLVPSQVAELLNRGKVKKIIVQPSTIRCYDDRAYEEAGAEINEDISGASTICAVKEVPPQLLIPDRTYLFFSHTIKAQPYNMPLLDTIMEKNIRLMDYERIVNEEGRMVKFGPYAGFGGMIDTLHALGLALLTRGFATPFLHLSLSKEYSSLDVARADLREIGEQIRKRGLPKDICPLTIAITGAGSVSNAAQQILHLLPCRYVEVEDLPKIWARDKATQDNHIINVVVVRSKDMVQHKDSSKRFSTTDYYKNPQDYESTFQDRVAPYVHVLINGMYWEPRFPRLLTTSQARELKEQDRLPLLCLGDITCDPGGSVEFFVKATTIQNPFYVYNLKSDDVQEINDFNGEGVIIMGVDHIPAEFPKEASTDFGVGLVPLIERVALSDGTADLESQKESLGPYLYNSQVTNSGTLTPHYKYIEKLRAKHESKEEHSRDRIVIFGAGMTSGPCVRHLLKNPKNSVTVVDGNSTSLEAVIKQFGAPSLSDSSPLRTAKANLTTMDTYVEKLIKSADCVISLLPAHMHPLIAESTIKHKVPLVTASYVSPGMEALREKAKESIVVNEIGLDPGIDIMTSADLLQSIRSQGGVIKRYVSLCGALCQPENSDGVMGYKFSWSPRGVLTAITRPTRFLAGGEWHSVEGKDLYYLMQPLSGYKGMDLNWIPNGNSERYVESYGLKDVEDLVRGTIRYSGYAPVALAYSALGLLNDNQCWDELKTGSNASFTWNDVMRRLIGDNATDLEAAVMKIVCDRVGKQRDEVRAGAAYKALAAIPLARGPLERRPPTFEDEMAEVRFAFDRLGLFSDRQVPKTNGGFIIDSLCSVLTDKMSIRAHERDFNIMTHRVTAHFPSKNKTRVFQSTLTYRGKDNHNTATAVTVGLPVGVTAQLILDGGLSSKRGLIDPTDPDLYRPVLAVMEKEGIKMVEEVFDVPN